MFNNIQILLNSLFYFSATIFSQTSSNTSQPFKTTVVTNSFDIDSPAGQRKTSRRISAKDGVSILEKFRKPTLEDISPGIYSKDFHSFQSKESCGPLKNPSIG